MYVTFTGKVLRWKMYLLDKDFDLYHVAGKEEHQFVPDALSRLCVNHIPPPPTLADRSIVALRLVMNLLVMNTSAILARYWEGFVKRKSQPTQRRQNSVWKRLNMLDTWYHSPKRSVFKSLTSNFQKLRRHFSSSLDWLTTSATMSRIWLRWFSPFWN